MATPVHANLDTSKFPYNFNELSSTIVMDEGTEINRKAKQTEDNSGLPQAYYMENTLPMTRGYTSVAYSQVIPPIPDLEGAVISSFEIRGNPAGLAILEATETKQYIYDANVGSWNELAVLTYDPGATTVANVKGVSYIYIAGSGIYTYDFMSQQLVQETVLGLDIGEVAGIFAAGAVLGAWTLDNRIFWSSTLNPVDFIPSLSTGAGSTSVISITSQIVTVLPLGTDFIIYTVTNAVSGRQTGNIQFPFNFDEVDGSTGITYPYHVAYNSNAGIHITYAASGFQQVNVQEAQYIWPELSEGIAKGIRIKLSPIKEQPVIEYAEKIDVKLQFCSNKYVVISIRDHNITTTPTPYTEAFVFDSQLNRWGKINCDHTNVLEYTIQIIDGVYTYDELESDFLTYDDLDTFPNPPLSYRDIDSNPVPAGAKPGSNFGIVGIDGKIHLMAPAQTANFRGDNIGIVCSTPRIFLGKYKLVRRAGIVVQGLKVNKLLGASITAHGHGYDGDYVRKVTNFKQNPRQPGHWLRSIAADSVSFEFTGSYAISDLSFDVESAGETNQFAVPAAKKFFSYINSAPYPVYVTEELTSAAIPVSGSLIVSLFIDELNSDSVPVYGELRDIVIEHTLYDPDIVTATSIPASGTLVLTVQDVFHTVYDATDHEVRATATPSSGTLIVTFFPIYHTVYDVDLHEVRATSIPFSGTLV